MNSEASPTSIAGSACSRRAPATWVGGPDGGDLYDLNGNRIRIIHPDTSFFTYDMDGLDRPTWVRENGADDPLLWYEGAADADRRSLIANHQGSIVAAVSAAGTAAPVNSYDPWGLPGANYAGRFGYTGQAWIPELGLWYYKARFYSPTTGRFMQTDPVGYDDQINLYAYVGNDPVNKVDPTGLYETNCATGDKACNNAARTFESARQANLSSRNALVVSSARAYGDIGQKNGVTVKRLSDKEMNRERGSASRGHTHSDIKGNKIDTTVLIRMSLRGTDLKGTVAHEGNHVAQNVAFAASYNSATMARGSARRSPTMPRAGCRAFAIGEGAA